MDELTQPRRYDRTGVLAVDPSAFTMLFAADVVDDASEVEGVPVVTISGPLEHHAGYWCDNYDAITLRVGKALEGPAQAIVLRIDSPGGMVSGCFEAARSIRAMADVARKRVICYVDGQATSAAYALASVADHIVMPATGVVGSIGVVSAMMDLTAANEAMGLRVAMVTSGARKADGNPDVPLTADALAATQDVVDTLAGLFFEHVATHRPAMTVESVRDLQAGLVIGQRAVALGLADSIGDFNQALAMARGETPNVADEAAEEPAMTTIAKAVEALQAAAASDDEEESARAKRMLRAMDEDEKPDSMDEDEDEGDKPDAEGEDEGAPESKAKAEDDEDDTSAKAIATRALASAERAERAQILASRPDLSAEQKSKLAGVPVEALAATLSAIPRATNAAKPPKAAAPTLGDGQGGQRAALTPIPELDQRMGFAKADSPIKRDGVTTTFGVFASRDQAREHFSKINGGAQ